MNNMLCACQVNVFRFIARGTYQVFPGETGYEEFY